MKLLNKEKARTMRKQGLSINQIVERTGYSKASVSIWVRDITLTKSQKNNISKRGRSIESIEKRRLSRINNEDKKRNKLIMMAKEDYSRISLNELKLIGIALYIGEGAKSITKGRVAVTNSDPKVIMIMMRFFREICNVPEGKFRGQIHTFNHANVTKTEQYWSDITKIPITQFYKTYLKQSSISLRKRKALPFGTFDLSINNTKLQLKIIGWIEKIKELITNM